MLTQIVTEYLTQPMLVMLVLLHFGISGHSTFSWDHQASRPQ
jgi:hypothetical protein